MGTRPKLEPFTDQILAWNVAGVPVSDQLVRLQELGVTVARNSLYKFRRRHDATITPVREEAQAVAVERAQTVAIVDQGERLRRLGAMADAFEEIARSRGWMVTEYRNVGGVIIEHERFDAALANQYRGVLHDTAIETGQIEQTPLPADVTPEVHATFQTLVVTDPGFRELAQRLFVRAAMGARDAGGSSLVRKRGGVAPRRAPDADQRRPPADRLG